MAGENSAIWRVKASAANGTEATADADVSVFSNGEVVLFNPDSVASGDGTIFNTEFNIRNSVPENPKVAGNNNEIQDMGLDGLDVQIVGLLTDVNANTGITKPEKLIKWMQNDKTVTGFTEGRFGLRIDDFPHFNVVPTSTYGYVLANLRFIRDPNFVDKVRFIATLRLGGDIASAF